MRSLDDPVQDVAAEVSLLGAAMSGYPDLDSLLETVQPSDFYQPAHEHIWAAIAHVHADGNKPDPISVRVALDEAKVKHDPIRLLDMTGRVPLVSQAPFYAQQVLSAAGSRALVSAGQTLQQLGHTVGDLDARREQARQTVDTATQVRGVAAARTLSEVMAGVIETAQNGQSSVISSGYPDLDRLIGGLAPGRLIVVGARPGIGKSLLGTNLALHMAHVHEHAVLLASLEMPEEEVGQRLLAAHTGVPLTALQHGAVEESQWERVASRYAALEAMPITVDDRPAQTVVSIQRAARNVQRTRPDLALIVVDYLQLVQVADRRGNRAEELGEVSRGLKLLARETGACVVAMAQVNREGTKHGDGRPKMTDLRESGSIEADADQVILLHQPSEEIPELELLVDKNRHGPKGIARLQVQGHYGRLSSVVWQPADAALV